MFSRGYLLVVATALLSIAAWAGLAVNSCEASDWTPASGGSWANAGNWTGGIPNGTDAVANFMQDTPDASPDFVITNVGGTIGSMLLQDTAGTANNGWELQGSSLEMDVSSGSALLNFRESLHEIAVPITLHDDLDVIYTQTLGDRRANLNRSVSSATGETTNVHVNRYNPFGTGNFGRVVFYGDNTFNGDLTLHAGTLQTGNWGSTPNGAIPDDSDVDVKSGATLRVLSSETFDALNGAGTVTGLGGFPNVIITVGNDDDSGDFSGIVQGGGVEISLTKAGAGTQTFTGTNTYSGTTTITGGTLQLGEGGTTGSVAGDIANDGTLAVSRSDNPLITNAISGSGGLTVVSGEMRLGAANSFTGTVTIEDGARLRMAVPDALGGLNDIVINGTGDLRVFHGLGDETINAGSLAGSGTVALGGTSNDGLIVGGNDNSTTYSGRIHNDFGGSGFVTKIGTGSLTLSGANTYTGTTTVSAGTLLAGDDAALGANSAPVVLGDANTGAEDVALLTSSASPLQIRQNITVSSQGTGTVTIGSSTSNHVVQRFHGNIAMQRSLTLQGTVTDRTTFSGSFSGAGDLIVTGPQRITFEGQGSYLGDTYITASTMQVQNGRVLPDTADVHVSAGATLRIWGNNITETMDGLYGDGTVQGGGGSMSIQCGTSDGDGDYSGVIKDENSSYTLSFVKAGAGTQILSGTNTYTGTTTITGGTLQADSASALGATDGGTTVADGAALVINHQDAFSEGVTLSGTSNPNGALQFSGGSNWGYSGVITLAATSNLGGPSSWSAGGKITGPGGLVKVGNRTLYLRDAGHDYAGATTINGGQIRLFGNTIPNTSDLIINNGASLNLIEREPSVTVALVTLNDGDILGTVNTVVTSDSGFRLHKGGVSAVLAGSGDLRKLSSDTVTLSQANSYTGTTTIEDGTLVLSGSGSIDESPLIDVQDGAIFDVTAVGGFQLASGHTLMGAGTVEGDLTLLAGSIHAPGASPGIQTVVGDYDLQLSATLEIELEGTALGSGYDQVNVDGLVTLDGTLDLALRFAPDVGSAFTIIDNDGIDGVVGNFAGLLEGDTLSESFGGSAYQWTITYVGGDGNDVVLSNVPEPATLCTALLAGLCLLGYRRRRTCS